MDKAGSALALVEAGRQIVRDDGRVQVELLEAATPRPIHGSWLKAPGVRGEPGTPADCRQEPMIGSQSDVSSHPPKVMFSTIRSSAGNGIRVRSSTVMVIPHDPASINR
jgi:hypothetical protein